MKLTIKEVTPLGYEITKASASDTTKLLPMVEGLKQRHPEIIEAAKDMAADKGYDVEEVIMENMGG